MSAECDDDGGEDEDEADKNNDKEKGDSNSAEGSVPAKQDGADGDAKQSQKAQGRSSGDGANGKKQPKSKAQTQPAAPKEKLILVVPGLLQEAALLCASRRADMIQGVVVLAPTTASRIRATLRKLLFFGTLVAWPWFGQVLVGVHRSMVTKKYLRLGFSSASPFQGPYAAAVSKQTNGSSGSSSSPGNAQSSGGDDGVRKRTARRQEQQQQQQGGSNGEESRELFVEAFSRVLNEAYSKGARFPIVSAARQLLLSRPPFDVTLRSALEEERHTITVPILIIRGDDCDGDGDGDGEVAPHLSSASLLRTVHVGCAGLFPDVQLTPATTAAIQQWAAQHASKATQ